jgi:hypothetical protein
MADTAMINTSSRRGAVFEFEIRRVRRGLDPNDEREPTAASVQFETADGVAAGGPYTATYDAGLSAWVTSCPARTEAIGTALVSIARFTVDSVVYEQRGTHHVAA